MPKMSVYSPRTSLFRFLAALVLLGAAPTAASAQSAGAPHDSGTEAGSSTRERTPGRSPGGATPHQGMRMPPEGMIAPHSDPFAPELLQRVLSLSDQQVRQMRQLAVNYEKETIRKQAEMEIARIDFVEELRNDKPDMAKVETLLKRMAGLEAELGLFRIRKLQETAGFLTPEQHKKFRDYSLAIVEQIRDHGTGEGYGSGMFGNGRFSG